MSKSINGNIKSRPISNSLAEPLLSSRAFIGGVIVTSNALKEMRPNSKDILSQKVEGQLCLANSIIRRTLRISNRIIAREISRNVFSFRNMSDTIPTWARPSMFSALILLQSVLNDKKTPKWARPVLIRAQKQLILASRR